MKIVYTTDLHYGMNDRTRRIHEKFFRLVDKEEPDILIISGDIISHKQEQYRSAFKMIRSYVQCPILTICGNHCYWNMLKPGVLNRPRKYQTIQDMIDYHNEVHKEFNIHYLSKKPYWTKDLIVYGFDGWYASLTPPSNDAAWIPHSYSESIELHREMNYRAHYELGTILDSVPSDADIKYKICVTHFAPYPMYQGDTMGMCGNERYLDMMTEHFDYLICGHNHKEANFIHEYGNSSIKVLNSGSDYNKPKYKTLILD